MKVLKDRILVSVQEKEEKTIVTEFGLTVPAEVMNEDGTEKVTVVKVGSNVEDVEEGEEAYMYKGAGKEITIDGTKYRVISPSEIIVVL